MRGYRNKPDASDDHRVQVRIDPIEYIAEGIGFASRGWACRWGSLPGATEEKTKKHRLGPLAKTEPAA
ncbi:MAG: hypothetical protein DWI02_04000 [Planctomycetota bacterium]|nr:MAG: hypothetical protein DWI02_04000 [Planctomycetota bacterium]